MCDSAQTHRKSQSISPKLLAQIDKLKTKDRKEKRQNSLSKITLNRNNIGENRDQSPSSHIALYRQFYGDFFPSAFD